MDWFKFYVFANVLVITLLALNVSRLRMQERVANGDGGKVSLKKAIRAHANGVEHVLPYGMMMFALQESSLLVFLVLSFTLSRVFHGVSMLGGFFNLRRLAALLTYVSEGAALVVLGGSLF